MDLRDYSYQQIVDELERRKAIQNSQNNNEYVMSPIVGEIIKVNRNAVEEENKKTEEEKRLEEIRRLKRELADKEIENDILKTKIGIEQMAEERRALENKVFENFRKHDEIRRRREAREPSIINDIFSLFD